MRLFALVATQHATRSAKQPKRCIATYSYIWSGQQQRRLPVCVRQYAEQFKRNLVDGLVLLSLTDKDLESELGIQLPVTPSPPSNAALVLALSL